MDGWHHLLNGRESQCQGASRAAPGKSGLHARGEGERVLAKSGRGFRPDSSLDPPLGPFGSQPSRQVDN